MTNATRKTSTESNNRPADSKLIAITTTKSYLSI